MTPVRSELGRVYRLGPHTLLCGDATDWRRTITAGVARGDEVIGCLVYDPPWDAEPGLERSDVTRPGMSALVFTDAKRLGQAVAAWGPPTWLFTWDTAAPHSLGEHRPLQQSKHCLWYGELDRYDRDATLWGEPPPAKANPGTLFTPDPGGRRLTDVYRCSLRWLLAGAPHPHMKPAGWITCLIGNTSSGDVIDPYAGAGTTMVAAHRLGRRAYMVEIDPSYCDVIRARWHALARLHGDDPGPDALDPDDVCPAADLRVAEDLGRAHRVQARRRQLTPPSGPAELDLTGPIA